MERETVKETVTKLICDVLDDEEIEVTEESGLMEDLDLSSLEIMTMIADIENEYHIVLKESELRQIVTVGDLIQCIQKK